jgi:hypothetical protein
MACSIALYNEIFASYLQGLPHGGELEDSPSEAGRPTRARFTEFKLSVLSFENRRTSALPKPNIDTDGEV